MRATYEQLNETAECSFLYRRFIQARLDAPFHFHPELELTLILEGSGRRLVGRQVSNFDAGDLVLLGPNLPHTWSGNDPVSPHEMSRSIVIQFKEHFAGAQFWNIPEMTVIRHLFQKAQSGLLIKGKTRDNVARNMTSGIGNTPFEKMLQLVDNLHCIATSDETELIDHQFTHHLPTGVESERFQKVYSYLMEHYREEIPLETIAAIANLTPTSFCRFFKKITRKTFVDTLTEFRLKHACQLLSTTVVPISDICFESGFGNISYFNKEFKKSLGRSPMRYRKMFIPL
jgi:AraC-like DNA-binding protein